jgi:phosphoribosylformylglycinamidine (FGAM) synthase PurS component
MRKSTIPFLRTSLFLLVLVSCGSNPIKDHLTSASIENAVYKAPYFSDSKIDYVYKTNISVYGNEMSGIFVVKRINETTHRVVFTTEFGNKLLDFEISENDFKIHSIVEELDRKMLIHTLVEDFRLLLRENYQISQQFESGSSKVFEAKDGKNLNYLFVSKADRKLTEIRHTTQRKQKITLTFSSENNIFAESIAIQHYNIDLKITFNHFNNQ